jgi:membrane-associated phospholipid phosphatase
LPEFLITIKNKMDTTIKKFILLFLLIIICGPSLTAQSPALLDTVDQNKYNFSQFGNETWGFIKQPTNWDGGDWLKIGLLSAGTYLIIATADQPIRDYIGYPRLDNSVPKYYNSVPIKVGNIWGDWYPTVILAGGFAIHGWLGDNTSSKKIAFEIVQSGLYTEFVTQIIKNSFGRARPYMEQGSTEFKPFAFLGVDYTSLPAGHTSWAFSLSTVLARNAKPVWLKVLAYIPAGLTFIARVYHDKHWTSDNFLGAAVGYFIATWVVDQHEKEDENDSKESQFGIHDLNIQPFISGDSYGFGLIFHL